MEGKRVVLTGVGGVTALGKGHAEYWPKLLAGTNAVSDVKSFDPAPYRATRGGEIHDYTYEHRVWAPLPPPEGRATQFAVEATAFALEDAQLGPTNFDSGRAGVVLGTTSGEPFEIERFNDLYKENRHEEVATNFVNGYPSHLIAASVARSFGLSGMAPVMTPNACAAGNYAIAYAFDNIQLGRAKVMVAGGSDSFSRITYTGFSRLGAIADDLCRPFAKDRKGMIPAEGAGIVILEELEHAINRNAPIYAELVGYGVSCDAYHMTGGHPDGKGAASAIKMALQMAHIKPDGIHYISAHGTGTPSNDKNETTALKRVFGDHAYNIPVSSSKSMLGHTMGAASALEAGISALVIRDGKIPPTINLQEKDPECDLDYVSEGARSGTYDVVLSNSHAFGGANGSIILRRYREAM